MTTPKQGIERSGLIAALTAAASPTAPDRKEFFFLIRDVEIGQLLSQADWHGITSLVYERLSSLSDESVERLDKKQVERFRRASAVVLAWNLHLKVELQRLSRSLKDHGIDFILLKGLGVAESLYDSVGSRPIGDIDLLIHKADFPAVAELLTSAGFQPFGATSVEDHLERGFHVPFYHSEKKSLVEIHWHISKRSHPDRIAITSPSFIEEWWSRSTVATVAECQMRLLSPEDLLGHLSIHFLKHRFGFEGEKVRLTSRGALIQLSDIARCLVHYGNNIDWQEFQRQTSRYGLLDLMAVVLSIVRRTFCDDPSVIRNVSIADLPTSDEDEAIANRIADRLFCQESMLPASTQGIWQSLFISLKNIFPPRQILAQRYSLSPSSPALPLYYAIRPFQLAAKFGAPWSRVSRFQEDLTLNRWIVGKGV